MGPTLGPPWSCRPQVGLMLVPQTLLSEYAHGFAFVVVISSIIVDPGDRFTLSKIRKTIYRSGIQVTLKIYVHFRLSFIPN